MYDIASDFFKVLAAFRRKEKARASIRVSMGRSTLRNIHDKNGLELDEILAAWCKLVNNAAVVKKRCYHSPTVLVHNFR